MIKGVFLRLNKSTLLNLTVYLAAIGVIFPTSINGDFSANIPFIFGAFNVCLAVLYIFTCGVLSLIRFSAVFLLICTYLIFTLVSIYSKIAWGQLIVLTPLLLVLSFEYKKITNTKAVYSAFILSSIYIVVVGLGSLYFDFLKNYSDYYYSASYIGLVQRMLEIGKPVSIFASHSLAAFYYFLYLLVFVQMVRRGVGNPVLCWVMIAFLMLSLSMLRSASSAFFLISSILLIAFNLYKNYSWVARIYFLILLTLLLFLVIYFEDSFVYSSVIKIMGDDKNGLASRYYGGVLSTGIEYIANNPFIGIGLSYSEKFYYTDSDVILTLLKVGMLGTVIYYYLCLSYLKKSTFSSDFIRFIYPISFFAFCFGMPIFTYSKFVSASILFSFVFMKLNDVGKIENTLITEKTTLKKYI